jgi:hypothetical protein
LELTHEARKEGRKEGKKEVREVREGAEEAEIPGEGRSNWIDMLC